MPISNVNRVKTIATYLPPSNDSIKTIYENSNLTLGDELLPGYKIISFNCFIKNLKVYSSVKTLPEITLPNFTLDDSETDKLYKTLDTEWGSARKQLNLYISSQADTTPEGVGWFKVGSLSLLNPSGYPYRIYNLTDLFTDNLAIELGDNGKIGIQVEDVGFGLLDLQDSISIFGSYLEEIFVESPEPPAANVTINNTTTTVPNTETPSEEPPNEEPPSEEPPNEEPPSEEPPVDNTIPTFPLSTLFRISASSINLANNSLVSNWLGDGNNYSASQAEITLQPIYKTGVLNSKSAVYFDGLNDFLSIKDTADPSSTISLIPDANNWAVIIVAKFESDYRDGIALQSPNPAVFPDIRIGSRSAQVDLLNGDGYTYTLKEFSYPNNLAWNTYILSCLSGELTLYLNGSPYLIDYTFSENEYENFYSGFSFIGSRDRGGYFMKGYLAEAAILGFHTIADLNTVGNFYRTTYGISWADI